jgi:hypothetical protein
MSRPRNAAGPKTQRSRAFGQRDAPFWDPRRIFPVSARAAICKNCIAGTGLNSEPSRRVHLNAGKPARVGKITLNCIIRGMLIVKFTRTTVVCAFGVFLMLSGEPFVGESVADTRIAAADEGDFEDDDDGGEMDGSPEERIDKLRSWLQQRNRERQDADVSSPEPIQETEEFSTPRRRYEPAQTWESSLFPYSRHSRHVARRRSHAHAHSHRHTTHASHSKHAHDRHGTSSRKHDRHDASSRGRTTHERTVHGHASHGHNAHGRTAPEKSTSRNSGKGKAQHASLQKSAKSAKSGIKKSKPSSPKPHGGSGKRRK